MKKLLIALTITASAFAMQDRENDPHSLYMHCIECRQELGTNTAECKSCRREQILCVSEAFTKSIFPCLPAWLIKNKQPLGVSGQKKNS